MSHFDYTCSSYGALAHVAFKREHHHICFKQQCVTRCDCLVCLVCLQIDVVTWACVLCVAALYIIVQAADGERIHNRRMAAAAPAAAGKGQSITLFNHFVEYTMQAGYVALYAGGHLDHICFELVV